MATCDMGYEHDDPAAAVAEPEIIPVPVDPGPNDNDVKIAEIEAAASIEREKLWTEQEGMRLDSEVQELRGEVRGMREILDRLAPPDPGPADAPVVITEPAAPDPPAEPVPGPPDISPVPKTKKPSGWWDGYR